MIYFETSPLLKATPHGFFQRRGGVSSSPLDSLNFSANKEGEAIENTFENKRRAMLLFKKEASDLRLCHQVHGKNVELVNHSSLKSPLQEVDGLVTKEKGIALGIQTADCMPVLFLDQLNQVAGACHAGWKGLFAGVIEETVAQMVQIGAKKESIIAVIGPCIQQESYEVDRTFKETAILKKPSYEQYFIPSKRTEGHFQFDLPGAGLFVLKDLSLQVISHLGIDTYKDSEAYFSCRRSFHKGEKVFGSQVSMIMLKD